MNSVNHVLETSKILQFATETRSVSYSEVASVTLLTWDVLITLSDEVEMIWKRAWTPAKGLYISSRYLPLIFQLALLAINTDGTTGLTFTTAECRKWMIFQAVVLQLVITTVDIILIMRVYALYNKSKILIAILALGFVAEVAFLSHVLAVITPKLTFDDDCFVTSSPPLFVAYWIVSLTFETVLFLLTLIKFGIAIKKGWGRRPVMKNFVSDGTWAYALIFVTMVINSTLYKLVHSPLAGICFTWLLTVLSFAGSRLILNPRRRSSNGTSGDGTSDVGGDLISIPLTPLAISPVSPGSATSPLSPLTPSSYKSRYSFGGTSRLSAPAQQRYVGWSIPPLSSPREQPVQLGHHDIDRLSFDSDSPLPQTRSGIGFAV